LLILQEMNIEKKKLSMIEKLKYVVILKIVHCATCYVLYNNNDTWLPTKDGTLNDDLKLEVLI